jgi:uncharacterized protein (TIGR03083 family)
MPLAVVDTRRLFRPLVADIVGVLRRLDDADWVRPTVAGSWRVRDVVAHLSDTALRRLSIHRDGAYPLPTAPVDAAERHRAPAGFINRLNASWVDVAQRFSPLVLTELYEFAGVRLAAFMEALSLEEPAIFPVSWAGDTQSPQWFDIGREFTEVWHHGAQVRDAARIGAFDDSRWLHAVLEIAMHALPHAYRDVMSSPGRAVAIRIDGPSGGDWTLAFTDDRRWDISTGKAQSPATSLTMSDETAWRLLFNALPPDAAAITVEGDPVFARPFLRARSVIL